MAPGGAHLTGGAVPGKKSSVEALIPTSPSVVVLVRPSVVMAVLDHFSRRPAADQTGTLTPEDPNR